MSNRALVWLRRDLRWHDHTALHTATTTAESVAVAFVFDRVILDALRDRDDRRVSFIYRSLVALDGHLRDRGSRLLVACGDPVEEVPRLATALNVQRVVTATDFEPYAKERDANVKGALQAVGVQLESVLDHVMLRGAELRTAEGSPYRVFTPFSRAWKSALRPADIESRDPDPSRLWPIAELPGTHHLPELASMGFQSVATWLEPGEAAAQARLDAFAAKMAHYADLRDYPAAQATSTLSVDLRFGTISPRQCARQAMSQQGKGAESWLNELIWREFYSMILDCFPSVVEEEFQPVYRGMTWPGSEEDFALWTEGLTGYPLVDAAMRHFKMTGWMHNRLRMVVASFLTKDLLVDWRWGEAWFARYLLDFDLASNNGGWQWAASTGCDAQPYFRIFNPVLQSKKFDPEGAFIRENLPELAGFEGDLVHWPHEATPLEQLAAGCELGRDYPHPIVDHHVQKERAIRLLESARR